MKLAWADRTNDRGVRWLPLVLLAISMLIALVDTVLSGRGYGRLPLIVGAVVLTAVWTAACHPYGRARATPGVYFVVRLALTAVLVGLDPWFSIYAWFGYVEAPHFFTGRRIYLGVAGVALISSASYLGGYPTTPVMILVWLALTVGSFALAGFMIHSALLAEEQGAERERTLGELTVANRRLEEALAENRGLQSQLVTQAREAGVLDERARLAGEIHDTLAQALTGIIRQLEAADRADELALGERPHLDRVAELARDGLAEARRSLRALRPGQLEGSTLPDAIADVARRAGIPVEVEVTGQRRTLPTDQEVVLLRVVQEALTNVDKHAAASRVGVTLSYVEDAVILDVRDNGVGFDPDVVGMRSDGTGMGLAAMRDRLVRIAGSLVVESAPGEGTALVATLPCPAVRGVA